MRRRGDDDGGADGWLGAALEPDRASVEAVVSCLTLADGVLEICEAAVSMVSEGDEVMGD